MLHCFGGCLRQALACSLCLLVLFLPSPVWAAADPPDSAADPLQQLLERDYLELFEYASRFRVSPVLIERSRQALEQQKKQDRADLKASNRTLNQGISHIQRELASLNKLSSSTQSEEKRRDLHCQIERLEAKIAENRLRMDRGLDIQYGNLQAKLDLLETWPSEYELALQRVESGEANQRKFGDFRDIGFRGGVFENQAKDIDRGREAVEELKGTGSLPYQLEDPEIVEYVRALADRIGKNSDLAVPLQVTVLESEEINAFALPGGYLFINTGLINETASESQLAGVIAHELAHVTARHGSRLMGKVRLASIIFESAQIAALVLTGGVASIATYYALQYGFYGLGLVLNLALLGVSREFETEADILATQYLWKSDFDPHAYLRFFSHMAEEKGGVRGISWFRTHPPFFERMKQSFVESIYLPPQEEPQIDSSDFRTIQTRLRKMIEEKKKRPENAPTLRRKSQCPPPAPEIQLEQP